MSLRALGYIAAFSIVSVPTHYFYVILVGEELSLAKGTVVTTINVEDRDITQIEADAIIMAANTLGYYGGAIDQAVQRVSGRMFFDQIHRGPDLADGQIIYTPSTYVHGGQFRDVIFMIDNLRQPLNQLVLAALQTAEHFHLAHVSLPAFRTGAMAGHYERTIEATADALIKGIKDFVGSEPTHVQRVTVAVYHNRPLRTYIHDRLLLEP